MTGQDRTVIASFTVDGRPVPKGRPRVTQHGTYTPQRTRDYERRVGWGYVQVSSRRRPAAATVSTDLAATLAEFSPRDRRIITGIVHGLGNQALADQEGVSLSSIRSCITRCLARLGLTSRVQLVVFAYESGLVIPGSAGAGLRPLGEAS